MFFINSNILRKREVLFLHVVPTTVVFLAFIGLTALSWVAARTSARDEQAKALQNANTQVVSSINSRMQSYELILRSGAALFYVTDSVSRQQWKDFVDSYRIAEWYPGVQAIGYTRLLSPDQLPSYMAQLNGEGVALEGLRPVGERELYSVVSLIEPMNDRNAAALGFDMYADETRRVAMDAARDTASVRLSGVVELVQETQAENKQPGFLVYMPVYNTPTISNVEERKASIEGFVYAPFRSYDFINSTVSELPEFYGFQLLDVAGSTETLLYESANYADVSRSSGSQQISMDIQLAGRTWRLQGVAGGGVLAPAVRSRPINALVGGLMFSFLIAGFIYLLLGNRARALAAKEAKGIEEAKDELLALASHQLRTPATGVKQYVGMLREGFAGELNDIQIKLLDKAYDSNERQLDTINEMLFVARTDAGHLKIEQEPFDIVPVVQQVVEEQKQTIEQKQQTIKVQLPAEAAYTKGDKQYLQMAIDNLVNNASKYTHNKGVIEVELYVKHQVIVLHIKDTGVGIADRDKHLLFRKFSRIPNELTSKVSGSGIGLYFAKKVIDSHDGRIILDSKEGEGTRITILLHLATDPQKS